MRKAIFWSSFWILLALTFDAFLYWNRGSRVGLEFLTAYVIEKSLSIDNIFVFMLIFSSSKISVKAQHKILFWGFFGALVMRAVFIFVGVELLERFHWITYVFGFILIIAAVRTLPKRNKSIKTEQNITLKYLRKFIPIAKDYNGENFFVRQNGKLFATQLFAVLLVVEFTDLIFATDSIPAVLAVTPDPLIVFTSNILAILGLRSLYFVLGGALVKYSYLHYGIAAILAFVGLKMLATNFYTVSTIASLIFIVGAISLSLLLSKRPSSGIQSL